MYLLMYKFILIDSKFLIINLFIFRMKFLNKNMFARELKRKLLVF